MISISSYYKSASVMPTDWLEKCADNPGEYMRPIHVAVIRLVVRQRKEKGE